MGADQAKTKSPVMTVYCVSPLVRIERPLEGGSLRITGGSGASRETVEVNSAKLARCIVESADPAPLDRLTGAFAKRLSLDEGQATSIIDSLVSANILVTLEEAESLRESGKVWERYGWRDAFDFHFAVYGYEWDRTRKREYEDALRSLYDDVEKVGPQPHSVIEREGPHIPLAEHTRPVTASLAEALQGAIPVNVFTQFGISLEDVASLLAAAHGVRFVRNLVLGEHLFKATPSGGARQPVEVYLAAREVEGLPQGVYHYDSRRHCLTQIKGDEAVADFDATCFDKGGIKTSSAILFFTYRYPRHAWKYRYARTYRSVLMELGHTFQATRIAATGLGLEVYYNPAIDDARVRALLNLGEDCDEGPMLSVGLGKGGTV
jgi:SagB-type dehydrogenase family enzyme